MSNWVHEVLDALDQQQAEAIDRRIRRTDGVRRFTSNDESVEADTDERG